MQKIALLLLLSSSAVLGYLNPNINLVLDGRLPVSATDVENIYEQWKNEFKVVNGQNPSQRFNGDDEYRKAIFAQKLQQIIKHNTNPAKTFKKGLNQFSDMTVEEFFQYYNIVGNEQKCSATYHPAPSSDSAVNSNAPDSWDWREHSGVTPVKDQGQCGSCWTFSTVGAVEAHFLLKSGETRSLSEQQLVDCAGDYDNNGCDGGLPSHAFEYIKDNGGLATEASYPYYADDRQCSVANVKRSVGVLGGSVNLTTSEDDLKQALYDHGPVSIAFEVVDDFMDYSSGVYASEDCGSGPLDVNHAVLAVGYGTEDGIDYWVVKNSWSTKWGDKGYFKIQRGVNMCGLENCNSYPQDVFDASKSNFSIFLQ